MKFSPLRGSCVVLAAVAFAPNSHTAPQAAPTQITGDSFTHTEDGIIFTTAITGSVCNHEKGAWERKITLEFSFKTNPDLFNIPEDYAQQLAEYTQKVYGIYGRANKNQDRPQETFKLSEYEDVLASDIESKKLMEKATLMQLNYVKPTSVTVTYRRDIDALVSCLPAKQRYGL
jgi:hypothetical protein